jgi:hypothetical protein
MCCVMVCCITSPTGCAKCMFQTTRICVGGCYINIIPHLQLDIFGIEKCYRALSQFYYWPCMRDDLAAFIRSCPICQRMKVTAQSTPELLPLPAPSRPFEFSTLDWLGGFSRNKYGHDSVLNIVFKFCKWVIVIPCDKHMNTPEL